MRLVTYSSRSETRIGALISRGAQNYILDLNRAVPCLPTDMIEFLEAGAAPDDRFREDRVGKSVWRKTKSAQSRERAQAPRIYARVCQTLPRGTPRENSGAEQSLLQGAPGLLEEVVRDASSTSESGARSKGRNGNASRRG